MADNNGKLKTAEESSSTDTEFNPTLNQWQSQDQFLKELEQELETVDPLHYRQVKYHKHEWDNIPPVVPKFIINLSKYVEGLSNWANRES